MKFLFLSNDYSTWTSYGSFELILLFIPHRSLVFCDVSLTDSRCKISRRHHQMASHGTVYDMFVDPVMEVVVTVGQVS